MLKDLEKAKSIITLENKKDIEEFLDLKGSLKTTYSLTKDEKNLLQIFDVNDKINLPNEPKHMNLDFPNLLEKYKIVNIDEINKFKLSLNALSQLITFESLENPYITVNLQNMNEYRPIEKLLPKIVEVIRLVEAKENILYLEEYLKSLKEKKRMLKNKTVRVSE